MKDLSRARLSLSFVGFGSARSLSLVQYLYASKSGQFDGFFYDFVSLNVIWLLVPHFYCGGFRRETCISNIHTVYEDYAPVAFGSVLVLGRRLSLDGWIPFLRINSFMGNAIWVYTVRRHVFMISFFWCPDSQKIPVLRYIVPQCWPVIFPYELSVSGGWG